MRIDFLQALREKKDHTLLEKQVGKRIRGFSIIAIFQRGYPYFGERRDQDRDELVRGRRTRLTAHSNGVADEQTGWEEVGLLILMSFRKHEQNFRRFPFLATIAPSLTGSGVSTAALFLMTTALPVGFFFLFFVN